MSWTLGVDFGTTNTAAAYRADGGPSHAVRLSDQAEQMPSAVLALDSGVMVAGAAIRSARLDPQRFEPSPKRRLGEVEILLGPRDWQVADLIGEVLGHVKQKAMWVAGGTQPDLLVLTYPQQWAHGRKELLARAAAKAGFDAAAVRMVSEPIAAATWYASTQPVPAGQCVAVFDFGGGTLDVAILRANSDQPGTFTVLAADGIDPLGGETLDLRLLEWTLRQLTAGGNGALVAALDQPENLGAMLTLKEQVRHAKHELAEYASALIPVAVGPLHTVLTITADEFDTLVGSEIDAGIELTRRALVRSGVSARELHAMYLTGGSSQLRLVHRKVTELIGRPPATLNDPKLVVAQGALLVPGSALETLLPAGPPPAPIRPDHAAGRPGAAGLGVAAGAAGLGLAAAGAATGPFTAPGGIPQARPTGPTTGGPPVSPPHPTGPVPPPPTRPMPTGSGGAQPPTGPVGQHPTGPVGPRPPGSGAPGSPPPYPGGPPPTGPIPGARPPSGRPPAGPPSGPATLQGPAGPGPAGPAKPARPKWLIPAVAAGLAAVITLVLVLTLRGGDSDGTTTQTTGATTGSNPATPDPGTAGSGSPSCEEDPSAPGCTQPSQICANGTTIAADETCTSDPPSTCWDGSVGEGDSCPNLTGQAALEWVFPVPDTWHRTCESSDDKFEGEDEVYLCVVDELPGLDIYLSRWSSADVAKEKYTELYEEPLDWSLQTVDTPVGVLWDSSATDDNEEKVGVHVRIYNDVPFSILVQVTDPDGAGADPSQKWMTEQEYKFPETIQQEGSVQ